MPNKRTPPRLLETPKNLTPRTLLDFLKCNIPVVRGIKMSVFSSFYLGGGWGDTSQKTPNLCMKLKELAKNNKQ